jgi:hypothetical protein
VELLRGLLDFHAESLDWALQVVAGTMAAKVRADLSSTALTPRRLKDTGIGVVYF